MNPWLIAGLIFTGIALLMEAGKDKQKPGTTGGTPAIQSNGTGAAGDTAPSTNTPTTTEEQENASE